MPAFMPCPFMFIPAFIPYPLIPAFIPCPVIPAFPAFISAPEPKLLAPAFDPYPLILVFITCPFKASLFPVRIYLPTVFPVKHLVN